ncbi:MAG: hypothetical protein AABZ08_00185 [Planctomycetota bacterium]
MTRVEARQVARTLRRQFMLSSVTTVFLLLMLVTCCAAALWPNLSPQRTQSLWSAAMLAGIAWMVLTVLSTRQVKSANQAATYLSAGRLDLAEQELTSALGSFSLHRTGKLMVCHNLAVVVHGQKNYHAAAELCDAIIGLHGNVSKSLGRVCRMLLADCRLFLGDTLAAFKALQPLLGRDAKLSLTEQMMLLPIELRCLVAQGKYAEAADNLEWKVQRAELLDSFRSALVHALLAKSLRELGRNESADFLQRRAGLLHDLSELSKDYAGLLD